ncbi:hypothetical protein NOCA2150054 [metagenome]|uniref:Uncharacterized protein n=1 Tax=metagenome TaxID=256318 RepID=A0A2P2C0S7_9ZZZZ
MSVAGCPPDKWVEVMSGARRSVVQRSRCVHLDE